MNVALLLKDFACRRVVACIEIVEISKNKEDAVKKLKDFLYGCQKIQV
ncbi:hypothetical protein LCGC14_1027250 [marine sediment metagenome]|uniref:Uncharacterized protein n=1 Tax=marine sediment metagenome TaxID=412755 RepID=A0A0F9MVS0_9ZZZZ